jgi:hypothetical protein
MTKRSYIVFFSLCLVLFSGLLFTKPDLINPKLTAKNTNTVSKSYFPMDLNTLKEESDIIIKGTVKETRPSYTGKVTCVIDEVGTTNHNKEAEEAYEKGYDMVFVVRNVKASDKVCKKFEEGRGLFFTDKVIQIDKCYKNSVDLKEVVVREEGGDIDSKVVRVEGETPLNVGDEVILFLKRLNPNKYIILGGPQGKYYVQGDIAVNKLPGKDVKLSELETEILS